MGVQGLALLVLGYFWPGRALGPGPIRPSRKLLVLAPGPKFLARTPVQKIFLSDNHLT